MFIYFIGSYLFFLFIYASDIYVKDDLSLMKKWSIKLQVLYKEVLEYYRRRFHLKYLIASAFCVLFALILWVVIERIFHNYYRYTHGIWHLLDVLASTLLVLSLKYENNYFI